MSKQAYSAPDTPSRSYLLRFARVRFLRAVRARVEFEVARTVSLSGARRRAVKGRFLWVVCAVVWRVRAFSAAVWSWRGVRGFMVDFVILGDWD